MEERRAEKRNERKIKISPRGATKLFARPSPQPSLLRSLRRISSLFFLLLFASLSSDGMLQARLDTENLPGRSYTLVFMSRPLTKNVFLTQQTSNCIRKIYYQFARQFRKYLVKCDKIIVNLSIDIYLLVPNVTEELR